MSLWATGPIDPHSRVATVSFLAVCLMVLGLVLWDMPRDTEQAADLLGVLVSPSLSVAPTATELPHSREVSWEGRIVRIFVSGQALEITSPDAPGGTFHAYMTDGLTSPVTQGAVRVRGFWKGWTCDYGPRCVPEVDIRQIEALSPELE